ncbi:unnamed protein product [Rotaria socialis]|uniref:Uncharacterized protein n=1 Tax=Rotaria socialis TaxID=392032 RepID=A0A820QVN9_9BILA|nr:unnamed protein product [Rotaria socialis]CAF3399606.1 unnamed protein product [Rotaria socialis]CAF3594767.1 unnamed protein product [Rotaria socialis]CAF4270660.1 unnamed protein product [Rotaria socialis]CAF4425284.1 unnamed protein product [Rotaria socialis]
MSSTSNLKNLQISILHFWNRGIRSVSRMRREASIPLRTIYYNIDKLKQTGSLQHRGGNGRPRVLDGLEKKTIGQFIKSTTKKDLEVVVEVITVFSKQTTLLK